jgi:Flp pilus assembly protein TadB
MTPQFRYGLIGVAIGLILLIWAPWWVAVGVIAVAIGVPVMAYRMLSPEQRRRLRRARDRRQLGG